jgi:hypothetical protein
MSYYLNLKPTKEIIDELEKTVWLNKEQISRVLNESKHKLLMMCMSDNSIDNLSKLEQQIINNLMLIKSALEASAIYDVKSRYEENENNSVWYCGWRFADWETNLNSKEELEEYIQRTVESFLILGVIVRTPDYFEEKERDKFYDKWNDINDNIDGYVEFMTEQMQYQVIDKMKEFIEEDKENEIEDDDSDNDIPQNTLENEDKEIGK